MKTPQQYKTEENLRFQIERILWKVEIEGKAKIKSFTVNLEKGSVKSVKCKFDAETH